tara:strand:+ start:58 stop:1017 length:960 start_codon:yes stop_codon:yes gene_type:complete
MATTTIASEIQGITGVTTADANFIVSAQKFVVANIPKNLLKWASKFTDPSSDGGNASGNIVVPIATDGILSVSRNGFSAQEVSREDSAFIEANSGSLKVATSKFPKYYFDNAVTDKGSVIIVKPTPTNSETAKALYIDHTKIDDDSDLRNVVINYACFKEFAKLMMREELQGKYEQYSTFFKDSTCDLTLNSTTVAHDANASIVVGLEVSNDNIPAGTYVQIINSSTSFELSNAATSAATNTTLSFSTEGFGTEHWIETEEDSEMLMARIQTIQAQIGERTHFGQLSQQHYNLALAEIKSYIENNPKTLATAMAMQGAR